MTIQKALAVAIRDLRTAVGSGATKERAEAIKALEAYSLWLKQQRNAR